MSDRWKMLQLACADEPKLQPDALEMQSEGETRTILTVEQLGGSARTPVVLVLGDDTAKNLSEWTRYEELNSKSSLLILKRSGDTMNSIAKEFDLVADPRELALSSGRMYITNQCVLQVSSTAIRARLERRESAKSLLHPDVYNYIIDKDLYQV